MSRTSSDRAKKLRSVLRTHYTRADIQGSLVELLADARHLARRERIDFRQVELLAYSRYHNEIGDAS